MKRSLIIVAALVAAVVSVSLATASASRGAATVVETRNTQLGRIIVDHRGHTLYLFEKDTRRHSACSGACAVYWPPLLTRRKPVARRGAKASRLGTIRRANGTRQVTYAGHPVYLYVQDTRPGQTTGEGSQQFGAGWDALTPAGKKIEKDGS